MKSSFLKTACLLSAIIAGTSQAAEILLTGQTEEPMGGDPFIIEHLESLGHNVTYLATENADIFGDDVTSGGFDLYIMSSTSLTSTIRENGFDTLATPILTWESSMVRDELGEFFITDDQLPGDMGTLIKVQDASHSIFAGLNLNDGDEIEIFDEPQTFFGLIGDFAPGASLLATGVEDEFLEELIMIIDLPAGGEVFNADLSEFENGLSPGHRLHIPLSDTSFEFINDIGLQIFNNALAYLLPDDGDPCDFDADGTLGIGDVEILRSEVASGANNLAFDLTGDGTVSADDLKFFVTNESKLHTYMGDANIDGEFNSGDLVAVFQAGKFETGQSATWSQGDWNGDGTFGSGDLVAAFQDGGFEQGPRGQAAATVPEPKGLSVLAMFAILVFVKSRTCVAP